MLVTAGPAAAARVERGNLIYDGVPDVPPGATAGVDAYLNAREAAPLNWSSAGELLVATRFGDVEQMHVLDRPGGARRQIGFLPEPVSAAGFSPQPGRQAWWFLMDTGGADNAQLYYQRAGDPQPRLLTDGKSVNGAAVWSNAGREIAFFSNARNSASMDIDIVAPESGSLPHLAVTGDNAAWLPLDWAPDDRSLLVQKRVSAAESYLYTVELSTGQKREIDPATVKTRIVSARFSRDGQGVYLISDRDSEFAQLRYVNLFNGEKTLLSGHIPWDIDELAISRDGRYLAYVSNQGGVGKLNLLDLHTRQELTPPLLPFPGSVDSLSFDSPGKRLAFGLSAANHPRDAYVLDIQSNRLEAWTASEAGAVDLARFAVPTLTQYSSFDRPGARPRQIPVYVYPPQTSGPHPVLILLHDGPHAQFRPGFDPWIQYVVNELGFAVIAPNPRGSSGYGKSYLALDNATLREDAVKDVGALLVWLGSQSAFDAKRVVVAGSGYGGYLTLAALVNFSDRLRGGVDFAGMTDFISWLSAAPPFRQSLDRAEYGDERDPDVRSFLRRISPLNNAERISRPVLIVHGQNDASVPVSESEQMITRLRGRGLDVWYLRAVGEGHEFRKKPNRDASFRTFAQFLAGLR